MVYFQDFVKEKYIEQKDEDVLWGKRAWTEVSPRSIMEFVSKVQKVSCIKKFLKFIYRDQFCKEKCHFLKSNEYLI